MKEITEAQKKLELDYVNSDITEENFPYTKPRGEVRLFRFGKKLSTKEAIARLDNEGYQQATLSEILAVNWNGRDTVVALGSVWQDCNGDRRVPCLSGVGSRRGLDLRWFDNRWHGRCWFAAVRAPSRKNRQNERK